MTTHLPSTYGESVQPQHGSVPVLASRFESGAFLADEDAKARTELIGTYWVRVLSRLLRRGIPRGDADSATREVFRRALHPSEASVPETDFPALLHRVAEWVCMDYYRRRRQTAHFVRASEGGVRTGTVSRMDFQVCALIGRNSGEARAL
jgi:hypothetical protein